MLKKLEKIAQATRFIPYRHYRFLVDWFRIMGQEDKEFGFIDVRGFDDQLKAAIKLLVETERQWQEEVLSGKALPFAQLLEQEGRKIGVDFPKDFAVKLSSMEKS